MSELDEDLRAIEWGHTPFDTLTPEELLRHCQRLYAACESMASCLAVSRVGDERSPYWGPTGSGAQALEQGEQALTAARAGFDRESIYRAFFRYARDLLFESKGAMRLGFDWRMCTVCGQMWGCYQGGELTGKPCTVKSCDGIYRPIEWDDIKPLSTVKA